MRRPVVLMRDSFLSIYLSAAGRRGTVSIAQLSVTTRSTHKSCGLARHMLDHLQIEADADPAGVGARARKERVVEAAAVPHAPALPIERRAGHDDDIDRGGVDQRQTGSRLGNVPAAGDKVAPRIGHGEGLQVVGTDDARQRDGDAAREAPADERRRVDLAAKRGEAEDGAGGGHHGQGGEAGAERRAAGAALCARHRVAPLEHLLAQRPFGRDGIVVASSGNAALVCGSVHGSRVPTCVVYSGPDRSIAGRRRLRPGERKARQRWSGSVA